MKASDLIPDFRNDESESELIGTIGPDVVCPECGCDCFVNAVGDQWCSDVDCCWANNDELRLIMEALLIK